MLWGASCQSICGAFCYLPAVPRRQGGRVEVGCGGGFVFRVRRWVISEASCYPSPAVFIGGVGVQQERQERPRAGVYPVLSCRIWAVSWSAGVLTFSEVG